MNNARVLIVEDNDEIAQMMMLFLSSRGFKVSVASDADTAQQMVYDAMPNLILLDVGLPDVDGYEVLKRLRQSRRTRYIPAIFVTQRSKRLDRLTGLQLGADDFITKPFDLEELCLRVQNAVARAARERLIHPLTGLPTGKVAAEEMAAANCRPDRRVVELSLRHIGEFRDMYGALAVVDLLRYVALMANRVLNTLGTPDDFLAQPADDAFVVITTPDKADKVRQTIIESFDHDVLQHYSLGERNGDMVKVKDSLGQEHNLPMLRLEVAPPPTPQ